MAEWVDILGVRVGRLTGQDLLRAVDGALQDERKPVFAYANIHTINLARRFPWLRVFLNGPAVTYPDGEGLRLAARLLGEALPPPTALTRWLPELCAHCEARGYSMYFLGSAEPVVRAAAERLRARFPRLPLAGTHHGYFDKAGRESDSAVEEINRCSPDVLIVGFGSPVQEEWISSNAPRLRVRAIFTGGACFEYASGARRGCPAWLASLGLEWLYRFAHDPLRLFGRYVFGIPGFLFGVLVQRLRSGSPALRLGGER